MSIENKGQLFPVAKHRLWWPDWHCIVTNKHVLHYWTAWTSFELPYTYGTNLFYVVG